MLKYDYIFFPIKTKGDRHISLAVAELRENEKKSLWYYDYSLPGNAAVIEPIGMRRLQVKYYSSTV